MRGLRQLIADHSEAVEYDLIKLGLRLEWLGTEALTWRDLLVIVRQSPLGSAVNRAQDPSRGVWGLQEQLLAAVFDGVRLLAWQNTEDGAKGRNRPEPLPRPGVEPSKDETKFGTGQMTVEEMEAWLASRNPLQHGGG